MLASEQARVTKRPVDNSHITTVSAPHHGASRYVRVEESRPRQTSAGLRPASL